MTQHCIACDKDFRDLDVHLGRTPLCRDWIDLLGLHKNYHRERSFEQNVATIIQQNSMLSGIPSLTCMSCHKTFSNKGNLNKHIKRNLICQKWKDFHTVQKRDTLELGDEGWDFAPVPDVVPSKFFHIIWNLFLTDRHVTWTQEELRESNIQHIISILPVGAKSNTESGEILQSTLRYHHTGELNLSDYDEMCQLLLKNQEERKNTLILCNSGYQRSIPFISYFLIKHHRDEVPNLEKALDIILPQISRENYLEEKEKYTLALDKYFKSIKK